MSRSNFLRACSTDLGSSRKTARFAVRERRKEIGVLKTLGFTSGRVMSLVVAESLLIALLGGAVGVLGSNGIMWVVTHTPGLRGTLANIGMSELHPFSAPGATVRIGPADRLTHDVIDYLA